MNPFGMFSAMMELIKQGKELTNAATWSNRAAAVQALAAFVGTLIGIAKLAGYPIPGFIDTPFIVDLCGAFVTLALAGSSFVHLAANRDAGLPAKSATDPGPSL